MNRPRVPVLTALLIIGYLLLFAGILHTAASFTPRMRQIELDMVDMHERIDAMLTEVEAMEP